MNVLEALNVVMLSSLLAVAVVYDIRFRRIPNKLVLVGMAVGLIVRAVVGADGHRLNLNDSMAVLGSSMAGGLTGLAIFIPFYALRTMGAGDVKLLAMVGIWVGAETVFWAALFTLAAGGVLALTVALYSGVLRQVLHNVQAMVLSSAARVQGGLPMPRTALQTTGRLPYAVAIACGTSLALVRQAGWLPL